MSEIRTYDFNLTSARVDGNRLIGHAAVFNQLSEDLGGFRERIAPGAFSNVLDSDVRLVVNHDPDRILARTKSGTLRMTQDQHGLAFEATLPDTTYARDLRESIRRGDVDSCSFRFVCGEERWSGDVREVRTVAELHDLTIATGIAAYSGTSVELRTNPPKETPVTDTATGTEGASTAPPTDTPTTDATATQTATATATPTGTTGTSTATGGLTVEQRTAAPEERSVEQRVSAELRTVAKGEARSLTTSAAISREELSTFLFDKLRASSTILASGITVMSTDHDSIQWPKLTADVSPAWYAEMDAITPGDPTFTTLTATPRKLAHLVQMSNEVIDDSDPSIVDVLNRHLISLLALRLDYFLIEGNGTAPQIRGLKNVSGTQTVSMGTNGASLTNLDPFADAFGLLEAANTTATGIVAHPRLVTAIRKLKDSQDRPLVLDSLAKDAPPTIYGVPVHASSQITTTETQGTSTDASTIYVFNAEQVVLVRRQDAVVELDRSRLFNQDASEMRTKCRVDLLAPNPEAIVKIVGVRP